jgi:hypothetical protein
MIHLVIIHDTDKLFAGIVLLVFGILGLYKNDKFGAWIPSSQTYFLKKNGNKEGLNILNTIWNITFILLGIILIGLSIK